MGQVDLTTIVLLSGLTMVWTLSIEPNHDKPCVVGDAWAEECFSCLCLEGGIAYCRPTYCASKLIRALDMCEEGQRVKVSCNTCVCREAQFVCETKTCPSIIKVL